MRVSLNLSSGIACQPIKFESGSRKKCSCKSASEGFNSMTSQQQKSVACFLLACERVYNKKMQELGLKKA